MEYFRIKNWKKHQHYKGRRPPWIKLHNELFDDYEFECLHDDSKLHLMVVWLLASRSKEYHSDGDPLLPNDETYLTKKSGLKKKINLKPLLSSGFLISYHDDSKAQADRKQLVPTDLDLDLRSSETDIDTESASPRKLTDEKYIEWVKAEYNRIIETPKAQEWETLFPELEVPTHVHNAYTWLIDHPEKRRTRLSQFIGNWLRNQRAKLTERKEAMA